MGDEETRDGGGTAARFLECAEQFAQAVSDAEARSKALALIAEQYAQAEELEAAADVAELIGDSYSRDQALADVAARAVELGDDDYADELLGAIDDPGLYSLALGQLAVKYAEAGEFDRAVETARELDDATPALGRIALLYADAGSLERAAEVADSMEDPGVRSETYVSLAAGALRGGRSDAAAELLVKAADAAGEIEFPEGRIDALIEMASLHKTLGEDERALAALEVARRLCDDFEGASHVGLAKTFAKDEVLVRLAEAFAGLGRFDLAEQVSEEIEDSFRFASALIKIALAYHAGGGGDLASKNLAEALAVALEEEVVGGYGVVERNRLLAELAAAYLTAGDADESLRVAGMISDAERRHRALTELATLCARPGREGLAFRAVEMIEDAYARAFCWLDLGEAFVAAGHQELAERAHSRALSDCEAVGHAYGKAAALMEAASASARPEGAAGAQALLSRSLAAASSIRDHYHRALALVALAGKYRELKLEATPAERELLDAMALKA
jgi:lipopolysaccharide biosynthesis regulator YciM